MTAPKNPTRIRISRRLSAIPRIGDTIGLILDPTRYILEKYINDGPVSTIKTPYQTSRVISGPDAVAFMASREGRECFTVGNSWRLVEEEFGGKHSLVTVDGEEHRQWRTVLQRGYSRNAIMGNYPETLKVIDSIIDRTWLPGARVRALPALQKFSIAELGTLISGIRPTEAEIEDIANVSSTILKLAPIQHMPEMLLKRGRYLKARSNVVQVAEAAIANSKNGQVHKTDDYSTLIDDIVASSSEEPTQIRRKNMLFHAVLPYFAGVETTSATETFALYLILRHAEVLQRIQHEVDVLFNSGDITHDRLFELTPTLTGAIMEAMRLYPVASFIPRMAAKDFVFKNHHIRCGEQVLVGSSVPHFLDEHFNNPMVFDVDRYRNPDTQHRKPGVYNPFGRGPHMCIGKGMAEAMMQLTLARIFHRVHVSLPDPNYKLKNRLASSSPPASFEVSVNQWRLQQGV